MAIVDRKNPYIYQLHPADSPAECWRLLWPSFHCDAIFLYFGFHCYQVWKDSTTTGASEEAYSLHRTQLQFLQQRTPGSHWVLKSPEHAINLPTLLRIYPDARIIHLHREPRDVIASLCNLAAAFQPAMVHNLSGRQLGHQITQVFASWSQQILLSRSRLPNDRICDITYADLVANPVETARYIHRYFKTPFDLTFPDLPIRPPETHAASVQSGPKYDLRRFDLAASEIDSLSEQYRHRFLR